MGLGRRVRCLCLLYKILLNTVPKSIYILVLFPTHSLRCLYSFTALICKYVSCKNSFFPYARDDWNKLDSKLTILVLVEISKTLKFIRRSESKIFNIHDQVCIRFLTRLQLGFSHLHEHKFRCNFKDTLNPLWSCSIKAENTVHFSVLAVLQCDSRKSCECAEH